MEAEDPLNELADIHLPDAVSFWPPAPGWWLLAAVILLGLTILGRKLYLDWQRRQRLSRVLAELETIVQTFKQQAINAAARNQAGLDLLYGINSMLKRVALVHYPETEVANRAGRSWLEFLDRSGATTAFTAGIGKVLGDGGYRPVFSADPDALYRIARQWIARQYRVDHGKQRKAQAAADTSAAPEVRA